MTESREQAAFMTKAICNSRSRDQTVEKLDGKDALEAPITARRQPHLAHTAAADQPVDRVCADLLARKRRPMTSREIGNGLRRILHEAAGVQRVALGEQIAQSCDDHGLTGGKFDEPALTLVGAQLERPIQVTAELVPQRRIKRCQAHTEWRV
jgi:hypothetical protein